MTDDTLERKKMGGGEIFFIKWEKILANFQKLGEILRHMVLRSRWKRKKKIMIFLSKEKIKTLLAEKCKKYRRIDHLKITDSFKDHKHTYDRKFTFAFHISLKIWGTRYLSLRFSLILRHYNTIFLTGRQWLTDPYIFLSVEAGNKNQQTENRHDRKNRVFLHHWLG